MLGMRRYNYEGKYIRQYKTMIEDVLNETALYIMIDFPTEKECLTGYNSIRQYIKRHELKEQIFVCRRTDNNYNIYRILIGKDKCDKMKYRKYMYRKDDLAAM